MNREVKEGLSWALLTAVISGTAIFVNKIGVAKVADPLLFTSLKNLVPAVVLGIMAIGQWLRRKRPVAKIKKRDWLGLVAVGLIGGSLPFYLFFKGLAGTEAVNASLIHKSLVLWVALLAVPCLGERLSWAGIGALGLIFGANLAVGGFKGFLFNKAELMILAATMMWAVENVMAKAVLKRVEARALALARMGIGTAILLAMVGWSGKLAVVMTLSREQWLAVLVGGGLLTGYVVTWYKALKLAPAIWVAGGLALGAVVTNILTAIWETKAISLEQWAEGIMLVSGVWFLVIFGKRMKRGESDGRVVNLRQVRIGP